MSEIDTSAEAAARSPHPLAAIRRLQDDITRMVMDAQERGVTSPQIALRMREVADAIDPPAGRKD